ncbi:MAG: hypothetical protein AAF330_02090 [Pseudomonadota bacterium]
MSDATLGASVAHNTGLAAAVAENNRTKTKAAVDAALQAEAALRVAGEQTLGDLIAQEVANLTQSVADEATARAAADSTIDAKITNQISAFNAKMLLVDQELVIAKGLNEGERTAVMALIEQGMGDVIASGQLVEMAARLTVVLDGSAVSVPDAIGLLWSKPSLASTKILQSFPDGLAQSTELTFVDGLTAVTTAVRDETVAGQVSVTYTASDFRGLGIDATATDIVSVDGDGMMTPLQFGELAFVLTAPEGSTITVANSDFDGDGTISEGSPEGDAIVG